jgi:hypothetical protein
MIFTIGQKVLITKYHTFIGCEGKIESIHYAYDDIGVTGGIRIIYGVTLFITPLGTSYGNYIDSTRIKDLLSVMLEECLEE